MRALKSLILLSLLLNLAGCRKAPRPLTVGGKSTLLQSFLAEVAAQHLENRLGGRVQRRLNLGDTFNAHSALVGGQLDVYPEYPCTALTGVLRYEITSDSAAMWERVRADYEVLLHLLWSRPLGFDNRFVVGIRAPEGRQFGVKSLGDLARREDGWRVAMTREFEIRRDGMQWVTRRHRIPLSSAPVVMDPVAVAQVLEQYRAEVVAASASDVVWDSKDLVPLRDEEAVILPCEAAYVMRADSAAAQAGLQPALDELGGKFSLESVRRAVLRLASGRTAVESAAHTFLREAGLSR